MCLNTATYNKFLTQKVWKHLFLHRCSDGVIQSFKTPYRSSYINTNGWIFPSERTKFVRKNEYHGGFIHAYKNNNAIYTFSISVKELFPALAINVLAQGVYNDIICRALYIPDADMTRTSYESEQYMKDLMACVSNKELIDSEPLLKNALFEKF